MSTATANINFKTSASMSLSDAAILDYADVSVGFGLDQPIPDELSYDVPDVIEKLQCNFSGGAWVSAGIAYQYQVAASGLRVLSGMSAHRSTEAYPLPFFITLGDPEPRDQDNLDWDYVLPTPKPSPQKIVMTRLIYNGRSKPLPLDDCR